MIHVREVLDRETQAYYWLTVYAQDSAAVPRSSFVDVLIEVDDVNDNRPQTAQPVYYPSVLEGSEEDTEVIRLEAFDHDIVNGGLTYDITSGNPQGFFAINRLTGMLLLSHDKTTAPWQIVSFLKLNVMNFKASVRGFGRYCKKQICTRFVISLYIGFF